MTSYRSIEVSCAVCGSKTTKHRLSSSSSFGSPDLDLRPPQMTRSTLSDWLEECRACGFVSSDLEHAELGVDRIMAKEHYSSIFTGPLSGTIVGRCLRRSILDEELGNIVAAAEHALWAAWAADDKGSAAAKQYRSRAADLFLSGRSSLLSGSEQRTILDTKLVDILRRAERWEEAINLADGLLAVDRLDMTLKQVVAFGKRMAEVGDFGVYTVETAVSVR